MVSSRPLEQCLVSYDPRYMRTLLTLSPRKHLLAPQALKLQIKVKSSKAFLRNTQMTPRGILNQPTYI